MILYPSPTGNNVTPQKTLAGIIQAMINSALKGFSGAVSSVFGRTGAVIAVSGDYTAAQITNVPSGNISAVEVQAALNELDSEKFPNSMNTNRLLGRSTAGVGIVEEISLGTNLSFSGTTLNVIGAGVVPAALTKIDDTNVTLTLGGTPATALLQATSLTLGWTGTLADARIASSSNWNTAYTNRITSLTTTGTSGAATLIANTLNIPIYRDVIAIPFLTNSINPSDATSYYCSSITNSTSSPTTTATAHQFTLGYAGTVIGAVVTIQGGGVAGTTEASTLKIRNITAATSSTVGTFLTNTTSQLNTTITGASIAVASSDLLAIEILTPTWVTNPTGLRFSGWIYITL